MQALRGTLIAAIAAVPFVLGQLVGASEPGAAPARTVDPLRIDDGGLREVLRIGLQQSPTLRSLAEHLERCHVIVYLSRAPLPRGLSGRTRLIGTGAAGWRFLSVELHNGVDPYTQLAALGHELQHVLEIADAGDVVDAASLAALYTRIGIEMGQGAVAERLFETEAAIHAGQRVRAEVMSPPGLARTQAPQAPALS